MVSLVAKCETGFGYAEPSSYSLFPAQRLHFPTHHLICAIAHCPLCTRIGRPTNAIGFYGYWPLLFYSPPPSSPRARCCHDRVRHRLSFQSRLARESSAERGSAWLMRGRTCAARGWPGWRECSRPRSQPCVRVLAAVPADAPRKTGACVWHTVRFGAQRERHRLIVILRRCSFQGQRARGCVAQRGICGLTVWLSLRVQGGLSGSTP